MKRVIYTREAKQMKGERNVTAEDFVESATWCIKVPLNKRAAKLFLNPFLKQRVFNSLGKSTLMSFYVSQSVKPNGTSCVFPGNLLNHDLSNCLVKKKKMAILINWPPGPVVKVTPALLPSVAREETMRHRSALLAVWLPGTAAH